MYGLPSKQYPRPMEASLLQRVSGWIWWYRWHCGELGLPNPGCSSVPPGLLRSHHMQSPHHCHCHDFVIVLSPVQQEASQGPDDHRRSGRVSIYHLKAATITTSHHHHCGSNFLLRCCPPPPPPPRRRHELVLSMLRTIFSSPF